jgi:hypothetical protein
LKRDWENDRWGVSQLFGGVITCQAIPSIVSGGGFYQVYLRIQLTVFRILGVILLLFIIEVPLGVKGAGVNSLHGGVKD